MYHYEATVQRWVDGDTVDLLVDLGFRLSLEGRFRLYGVDTPERGQEKHDAATAFVTEKAPVGTIVDISTYKDHEQEKYGRWLADIVLRDGSILCTEIIHAGLGVAYYGGTKGVPADGPVPKK